MSLLPWLPGAATQQREPSDVIRALRCWVSSPFHELGQSRLRPSFDPAAEEESLRESRATLWKQAESLTDQVEPSRLPSGTAPSRRLHEK